MEKKKNTYRLGKYPKNQYQRLLEACKTISNYDSSLVNRHEIIYNLNINIPSWKDLSKVQKVAIFFNYIADCTWFAVTLRFSNEFIDRCMKNSRVADFIRRRLNENFKNRLGYTPEYLFCVEFDSSLFHIHGAIKPHDDIEQIERVLKTTAFGQKYHNNPLPERNKVRCQNLYQSSGWGQYILKQCSHKNFDVYICLPITRQISDVYEGLKLKRREIYDN